MGHSGEQHPIPSIGFFAIAASCEKASDSSKSMGDRNAGGSDDQEFLDHWEVPASDDPKIPNQERNHPSDEASIKGHRESPSVFASFFDEVIEVLEQNPRDDSDKDCPDRVELQRKDGLLGIIIPFQEKVQEP